MWFSLFAVCSITLRMTYLLGYIPGFLRVLVLMSHQRYTNGKRWTWHDVLRYVWYELAGF